MKRLRCSVCVPYVDNFTHPKVSRGPWVGGPDFFPPVAVGQGFTNFPTPPYATDPMLIVPLNVETIIEETLTSYEYVPLFLISILNMNI